MTYRTRPIKIIHGGPGSGKTQLVNELSKAYLFPVTIHFGSTNFIPLNADLLISDLERPIKSLYDLWQKLKHIPDHIDIILLVQTASLPIMVVNDLGFIIIPLDRLKISSDNRPMFPALSVKL